MEFASDRADADSDKSMVELRCDIATFSVVIDQSANRIGDTQGLH